jgi:hypothetical protein
MKIEDKIEKEMNKEDWLCQQYLKYGKEDKAKEHFDRMQILGKSLLVILEHNLKVIV